MMQQYKCNTQSRPCLYIISLHLFCPNLKKYFSLRSGSLEVDSVIDYKKGEVKLPKWNFEEFLLLGSEVWKKKQIAVTNLLHLMTANRKTLLGWRIDRVGAVPKFATHFLIFNLHVRSNKKAWPKWAWPKWVWPESQVSMIFVSM